MEIDRLSALPDDLLFNILRRLYQYDTKEVAKKTAALSKRWRFLWTKLPLFSFTSSENGETGRFLARVRAALAARKKANLEHCSSFSLYLSLYYDDAFADELVALLDFAAESRVRDFNFSLKAVRHKRHSGCTLPEALYSYPSLRKLSLNDLKLVPPATTVKWGLMTELSLLSVELPQQALDQIVSGCPLLARFKVVACLGFNRLDIRGRRFRELDVADGCGFSRLLEISAPYMTSMYVNINPGRTTLRLTDVSSVERVRICFWFCDGEMESFWNNEQLFKLLQRVSSLVLYYGMIQVLSNMRKDSGGQLPQFRVQHLTIQDYKNYIDTDNNISDILAILESSPFLSKLVIHDKFWNKHKNMNCVLSVGVDLICDLLHLKTVEIGVRVNPKLPHELSFTLAQILLRRAPVLEEMVIRRTSTIKSASCIELVKKFGTLRTYPKSSQKAVVHISL